MMHLSGNIRNGEVLVVTHFTASGATAGVRSATTLILAVDTS